jgi:hypothetical protein
MTYFKAISPVFLHYEWRTRGPRALWILSSWCVHWAGMGVSTCSWKPTPLCDRLLWPITYHQCGEMCTLPWAFPQGIQSKLVRHHTELLNSSVKRLSPHDAEAAWTPEAISHMTKASAPLPPALLFSVSSPVFLVWWRSLNCL